MKNILPSREIRHKRIRSRIKGTQEKPRLSVFRSLKCVYAQLIDDENSNTIIGLSEKSVKDIQLPPDAPVRNKEKRAFGLGWQMAQEAKKLGITKAVFDRGGYAYHGRVKAVAEGARAGGLKL